MEHKNLTQCDTFQVLDIAKAIGLDASAVRRKLSNMNGQVNFDRAADTLTTTQLRVLLPTYITGARQLTGEKREAVNRLLNGLVGVQNNNTPAKNDNVNTPPINPVNPDKRPINTPDSAPPDRNNTPAKASPDKAPVIEKSLENVGLNVLTVLGSLIALLVYYILFLTAESFIQADLLNQLTGLPMWALSVGTFSVLFLLVFTTINARYDSTPLLKWSGYDFQNHTSTVKGFSSTTVSEALMWAYNVAMCQGRFFLDGWDDSPLANILLLLTGFAIPTVIAVTSRMIKNRITSLNKNIS